MWIYVNLVLLYFIIIAGPMPLAASTPVGDVFMQTIGKY
jgi:hypothetical protein